MQPHKRGREDRVRQIEDRSRAVRATESWGAGLESAGSGCVQASFAGVNSGAYAGRSSHWTRGWPIRRGGRGAG